MTRKRPHDKQGTYQNMELVPHIANASLKCEKKEVERTSKTP